MAKYGTISIHTIIDDYPCVYALTNTVNGKQYIGSTVEKRKRLNTHWSQLRLGNHHSTYLQNAYNKYGRKNFTCQVLTYCDKESLRGIEQMYIDQFKPDYNIATDARYCGITGASLSEVRVQRMAEGRKKPVAQYRDGKLVAKHPSSLDAEEATGINRKNISSVCRGERNSAGGYQWKFIPRKRKLKYHLVPIEQYDMNGTLLETYPSSAEAGRQTGVDPSCIRKVCKGQRLQAGGYKWKNHG